MSNNRTIVTTDDDQSATPPKPTINFSFDTWRGQTNVIQTQREKWRRLGQVGDNFQITSQAADDTNIECEKFYPDIIDTNANKDRQTIYGLVDRVVSYVDDYGQTFTGYVVSAKAIVKPIDGVGNYCLFTKLVITVQPST